MISKNNYVLKFVVASLCTLGVVVGIIYLAVWNNDNKLQGKLVFSDTFNKGIIIDRIELQTTEETVVLLQNNSYWTVENRNNYYADYVTLNVLLNALNKSIYSVKFPYVEDLANEKCLKNPAEFEQNSGMLIRTFAKGEKIDEIIVGLADESKTHHFARNLKDDNIWLISESFNLPIYSKDWILRPIVSIPIKNTEIIQIDDKQINRLDEFTPFYNQKGEVINIDVLEDVLSMLYAVDAIPQAEFEKNIINKTQKRSVRISTFIGLIFELDIFSSDDKKVWCKIKLSSTSLPMKTVNDYINDNKFLYDGWYFEISNEQGHIIRDFRL